MRLSRTFTPRELRHSSLARSDPSKLDACPPQRCFPRHAATNQIFSKCVDVKAQLCIHLAFHARAPRHCAQPRTNSTQQPHTSSASTHSSEQSLPRQVLIVTHTSAPPSDRPSSPASPGHNMLLGPKEPASKRPPQRWAHQSV